jgi:hypothetical protein
MASRRGELMTKKSGYKKSITIEIPKEWIESVVKEKQGRLMMLVKN